MIRGTLTTITHIRKNKGGKRVSRIELEYVICYSLAFTYNRHKPNSHTAITFFYSWLIAGLYTLLLLIPFTLPLFNPSL